MKLFRELEAEADRRWEEQSRREHEAWDRRQAVEDERRQSERDRKNEIEIAEYRRRFAALSQEEQDREREASSKIIELIESGQISKADFFKTVIKEFGF